MFSLGKRNTYIQEEGRGKGILKDCEEKVEMLMKRLVRDYGSNEVKGQETSGSKEWLTESNTQQSSKMMTMVSSGFDKWSRESQALEYLCAQF